jgi:hypothetical protein
MRNKCAEEGTYGNGLVSYKPRRHVSLLSRLFCNSILWLAHIFRRQKEGFDEAGESSLK